jgi:hypothetical protein
MLRIYLDTNLLTKLDQADHSSLKGFLLKYSDYLNTVYSSAHISDLERSSDLDLTQKDLTVIRHYSENQCLAKYWGDENLQYDTRDPIEFYESTKKEPFGALKTSLSSNNDLLKVTRSNIDKQLPRKYIGNVKSNIFDYLNSKLPETFFKKNFDEIVSDSLKLRGKDGHPSFFDRFVTRYNTLDLVGYKSDNKSSTMNIVIDGFHAFYAAHCDILISEDKRFREKSQVMYHELGIETRIFSEKDFCDEVDNLITPIKDMSSINELIKGIRSLNPENYYSVIDTKSLVAEYFTEGFFAGFFNYIIQVCTNEDTTIIALIKEHKTLSNWFYYKELKYLVRVFVNLLGSDAHGKGDFLGEHEFEDDNWIGRTWLFESILMTLSKKPKETGCRICISNRELKNRSW